MTATNLIPLRPPVEDQSEAEETRVWLTRGELAARLRLSYNTVEAWAVQGKGPRFAKFGRHVRYRLSDVIAWEEAQIGGGA